MRGETNGEFHSLRVRDANGVMQDILVLLAAGGGGGSGGLVASVVSPLSIDGAGALSVSLTAYATTVALNNALASYTDTTGLNTLLAGYLQTSHEAGKIGSSDVVHGGFDIETRTLTLKNAAAVTKALSVDNGGNLVWAADGLITVPMLAAQEYTSLSFRDSASVVRNMVPSANGSITYAGSQLASISDLAGYQQSITAGTGISLVGSTLSTYALKWDTSNSPAVMPQCLIFNDFSISQNLNINSSQYEFIVTAPVSAADLALKQDALVGVTQSGTSQVLLAPTHMPTISGSGGNGWVDQGGTHATIGLLSTVNGWNWYHALATYSVGQVYTLTAEVRLIAGSTSVFHMGFIYFNGSAYVGAGTTFDASHGLNVSTFTTINFQYTAPVTSMYHVFGCAPISHSQTAGSADVKGITITAPAQPEIEFSNAVSMLSTLDVTGIVTGHSFVTGSDASIKTELQEVDSDAATAMVDNVIPYTYMRTDLTGPRRLGFISQHIQTQLPQDEWGNLLGPVADKEGQVVLGLDYSRLVVPLWACLRKSNAKQKELEARLAALESAE